MKAAGWAPRANSLIAHATIEGAGTPPISSDSPMRNHSPCCHARNDFLNGSGSVTAWVSGSNVGGWRSVSANDSASGPSASRAASPSISRTDVAVEVAELARRKHLLELQHLEEVELEIAHVALVVAHAAPPLQTRVVAGLLTDVRRQGSGVIPARPPPRADELAVDRRLTSVHSERIGSTRDPAPSVHGA